MFIKLGIIAGILILGVMIFSNEIGTLFPSTSASVVDSLKNDVSNFSSKASTSVEKRIDGSIDEILDNTSNIIYNEINQTSNKISNEIYEVKNSSQKILTDKISNFNLIKSINNLFVTNPT